MLQEQQDIDYVVPLLICRLLPVFSLSALKNFTRATKIYNMKGRRLQGYYKGFVPGGGGGAAAEVRGGGGGGGGIAPVLGCALLL